MIETTPYLSDIITTDPVISVPELEGGVVGSEGVIVGSEGPIRTSEDI